MIIPMQRFKKQNFSMYQEITSVCDKNGNQMSKVSTDIQQDVDSSSVKDIEFRNMNSSLKASPIRLSPNPR